MRVEAFLVGVIAVTSLIAALFFLKFWRRTRDSLFLAFSIAFLIMGLNRMGMLRAVHPNERSPWSYVVRLIAFLIILAGILRKNYGREKSHLEREDARANEPTSISSD